MDASGGYAINKAIDDEMTNLTPKQEAFVQAYLKSGNQRQAYRAAYSAQNMTEGAVDVEASKLMRNPKVALKLKAQFQAEAEATGYTRERIATMLQKAFDGAITKEQHGAAVAASVGLAKLYGLIIDKKEVSGELKHRHAAELSESELLNIASAGRAGASPPPSGEREPDRIH